VTFLPNAPTAVYGRDREREGSIRGRRRARSGGRHDRGAWVFIDRPGADAVGPDGTLWLPTFERDGFWRVPPDGTVTRTPGRLPAPCFEDSELGRIERASDGAMWLTEPDCAQLTRIAPAGTTTIALPFEPAALAADAAGGVWVAGSFDDGHVAHVDAAGGVNDVEGNAAIATLTVRIRR
jgi:hypothetical protein